MSTLTANQIEDIRQIVGDSAAAPDVTDAQMQRDYDAALLLGEDAVTTQAITIVYTIRRLIGAARKKIDVRGEVESESRSQIIKNLTDMLSYWEGLAGISGVGVMSTGSLDMGIDLDCDDLETAATWLLL